MRFFIFGLPRSRTAWLSNVFTTDRTFCYHQTSMFYGGDIFNIPYEYVGEATPSPSFLSFDIKDSPVVIIERPLEDCIASCNEKYMGDHSQQIEIEYEALKKIDGLRIPFCEINDRIVEIWQHLIPTIEPDRFRLHHLKRMNVQSGLDDMNDLTEYVEGIKCHQ